MQKTSSLLIVILLLVNFINHSYCGSCSVDKSVTSCTSDNICPTIRSCIEAMISDEDYEWIISVNNGTYNQPSDCIGSIDSVSQPFTLLIEGNRQSFQCDGVNFLNIDSTSGDNVIYLANINLSGSVSEQNNTLGGCITASTSAVESPVSAVVVVNSTFSDCYTPNGYGGAINSNGFDVVSNNSFFFNNTAGAGSDGGGAISALTNTVASYGSWFYNNTGFAGGAISCNYFYSNDSTFEFNVAEGGGAVMAQESVIENSHFDGNRGVLGSVFLSSPVTSNSSSTVKLLIIGSIFINNIANTGTIYIESQEIIIESSLFANNSAIDGSGIYFGSQNPAPGILYLDNLTVFYNNSQYTEYTTVDFSVPTTITGGQFLYDGSSSQTPFPTSYMNQNSVNVESPANCTGSPSGKTFQATMWTCFNVEGYCINGFATVVNSVVTSCKCFNGWSGSNCNTQN